MENTEDSIIKEMSNISFMERQEIFTANNEELKILLKRYEKLEMYGICLFIKNLLDDSI